jgi:enoyl-CoA hydratase/carnithine racemase
MSSVALACSQILAASVDIFRTPLAAPSSSVEITAIPGADVTHQWECLKVTIVDGVGHITLDRPDVLNALNHTIVLELEKAVRQLDSSARVILLEGAGNHFCAGADLQYLAGTQKIPELIAQINAAFFAIERALIPVVVAVQGYALAGGFELMQACDIVFVSDTASIGDQHANFGLIPGGGGSQRLPRLVGRQRALALLLSGDRLSGREAAAWGLAYRSVPAARLHDEALKFSRKVALKSREGLMVMKSLVNRSPEQSLDDSIKIEVDAFHEWIKNEDAQEGLRAFKEKRSPRFK